ncbi:MAG: hypothetical protein HZC41_24765 [Chloroflexi bacterium]|nr:hypothetical protein [Chloroflexota bacterium]
MRVQRASRRNPWPMLGCGCAGIGIGVVLMLGIGLLLLLPALPGLAARVAGLTPKGDTQAVFASVQQLPTPEIRVQNPVAPPDAVLDINQPNVGPLPASENYYSVATGVTNTGAPAATVTFTEANLMELCVQRTTVCSNTNDQFRNVRIDLRPGGVVIYADVQLPDFPVQQTVGIALRLDSSGRQFEVAGVDIGGQLFDLPPGTLGDQVAQIAANGNALLQQMELEAGGGQYRLSQVYIDDTTATLVLQ